MKAVGRKWDRRESDDMRKRDKDSEYTVNVKLKKVLNHRYKKQFLVLAMILSVSVLLSAFAMRRNSLGISRG